MKHKVLIITPFLTQGGVEHTLITALSGIDYKKNDVTLFLYKDDMTLLPAVPPMVQVLVDIDRTHYYRQPRVVFLNIKRAVQRAFRLNESANKTSLRMSEYIHERKVSYPQRKYFHKSDFDIVISYSLHIGTEMALRINAKKRYLFIHNSHTEYHSEIFEPCAPLYDGIIAVNDGVKKVYAKQYPAIAEKIDVLENYVDAAEIRGKADQFTVDYHKRTDEYIICSCGRFSHEKGFDLAIGAAHILKERGYSFVWFFVGDGKCRPELEEMIKAYGLQDRIMITGFQENPYPYIRFGDVYVQPSYEEAQPLTMLEARKLGRPIVSTKTVGGIGILKGGELGVLTEITSNGIADGIARLLDDADARRKFGSMYNAEDDKAERTVYRHKWDELLSSAE